MESLKSFIMFARLNNNKLIVSSSINSEQKIACSTFLFRENTVWNKQKNLLFQHFCEPPCIYMYVRQAGSQSSKRVVISKWHWLTE